MGGAREEVGVAREVVGGETEAPGLRFLSVSLSLSPADLMFVFKG